MRKSRFTESQILAVLDRRRNRACRLLRSAASMASARATYYQWKSKYAGM